MNWTIIRADKSCRCLLNLSYTDCKSLSSIQSDSWIIFMWMRAWSFQFQSSSSCIRRPHPLQLRRYSLLLGPDSLPHLSLLLLLRLRSYRLVLLRRLELRNKDLSASLPLFDPLAVLSRGGATVSIGVLRSAFALRSELSLPASNALNVPSLLWVLCSDFRYFWSLIGFV